MMKNDNIVTVNGLDIGYDENLVLKDINFSVKRGEIFAILGGSGSGKSTILKHMIGLYKPLKGEIIINGKDIVKFEESELIKLNQHIGVLYQSGALFSSMNILENVMLPLREFTELPPEYTASLSRAKLGLVGLSGFEDYYPHELSGGMKKRAAIARALALNPDILFFDEPSAGLDPLTSIELDDLILELKNELGTTIIIVTHELESIFAIADTIIVLDQNKKTIVAHGEPHKVRESSISWVRKFLNRSR
ncbi:MAG: ATP-binding cassette domain-containing protein [Victivallales bacterium]|nr:ATP-binding cassette domain-containing protein [Victivallales bacterium]